MTDKVAMAIYGGCAVVTALLSLHAARDNARTPAVILAAFCGLMTALALYRS